MYKYKYECIYIYINMYIYKYVYIYIYICIYVHTHIRTHAHVHVLYMYIMDINKYINCEARELVLHKAAATVLCVPSSLARASSPLHPLKAPPAPLKGAAQSNSLVCHFTLTQSGYIGTADCNNQTLEVSVRVRLPKSFGLEYEPFKSVKIKVETVWELWRLHEFALCN